MTSYVENETETGFSFPVEETVRRVMEAVLDLENCPYEASVNVLLTDDEGIREFNRQFRETDRATDVLSFPNVTYDAPSRFRQLEEEQVDCFDPDSGELLLGDIVVSIDRIKEQADAFGHSQLREFAFLVAHSMLHLCGYDHMEEKDASVMEEKQSIIMERLNITRDRAQDA